MKVVETLATSERLGRDKMLEFIDDAGPEIFVCAIKTTEDSIDTFWLGGVGMSRLGIIGALEVLKNDINNYDGEDE